MTVQFDSVALREELVWIIWSWMCVSAADFPSHVKEGDEEVQERERGIEREREWGRMERMRRRRGEGRCSASRSQSWNGHPELSLPRVAMETTFLPRLHPYRLL